MLKLRTLAGAVVAGSLAVSAVAVLPSAAAAPAAKRAIITVAAASVAIDAGTSPVLNYTVTRFRSGAKILMQRQYGTAGVWKTVGKLTAASGSFTAPAVGQGEFVYRVAVKQRKRILAARTALVRAYAPVSMETFLNDSSSTTQIGTRLFRYVLSWTGLSSSISVSADDHTCRHLSLEVGLSGGNSSSTLVTVVQEAADPASVTVPKGEVKTLEVDLAPGAFQVTHSNSAYGYLNGTLSCYTPSGFLN